MEQACQCPCGANQFSVSGEPIVSFFCHCTICQKKYNAPFADVVLFKLGAVTVPDQSVSFAKYKRVAAIDRGICDHCHKPVMAKMGKDGKGYAFITAQNFTDPNALPESAMHVFYGTRKTDIQDALPKHSNWFSSQLAFFKLLKAAG